MAKKFILIWLIITFSTVGSSLIAHAATPVPVASAIDNLDNRGETEGIAGITWDEINEMAQNSPNSLSPIQGLVLWMFTILAFLKLAQKMDSLLQSLGLNVTQTGGRAVGDLVMAGMALKHIGGAISKGMGVFGFGGKGGGASGGTSRTGGSAGSAAGASPIPAGGQRGSLIPTGASTGGISPGTHTTSSGTPTGTPLAGGNAPTG